jgi:trehalose 6-phosphate synthase
MTAPPAAPQQRLPELQRLLTEMLERHQLIIASNRGPIEYNLEPDGSLTSTRGSGGMVTALMAASRFVPATWVASAMTEGDRVAAEQAGDNLLQVPEHQLHVRFVTVPPAVYQRHYYVFCNPLLWFIQHFMWNTPRTPNIGRAVYEAWETGYIAVNEAIAEAIVKEARSQDRPSYVLLQDYHLYLAPAIVRREAPDSSILHFTHIPWPSPRNWGLLPEFMRRRIHHDMLSCDIVGLQTASDVRNFLHSCEDIVPGVDIDYGKWDVHFEGHTTRVRHYPISVDAAGLLEYAASEEVERYRRSLASLVGEQTIVRVDRSEPSKNVIRGLRAFELLLDRYPEMRTKVNLIQFLVPSRSDLGVYQTYTDEIFELVDSINDHFGEIGWQPVTVLYENNYAQAIAGMYYYDVLMVNPLVDGMNLVAKEGPLVNKGDGVLLLSEMAGAHEQLGKYSLSVSPTDIEGTVNALHEALTMPAEERRRRAEALRGLVEQEDIVHWLERQLRDLVAVSEAR